MKKRGIGAIHKKHAIKQKYADKGSEMADNQLEEMSRQLEIFREKLEEFAAKHKNDIKKDPQFRQQFQEMCAAIGVDPLASSKGFWSELLGVGDFYYELGVQIIEVCMAASHRTGGLMELGELRRKLITSRGKSSTHQEITNEDLLRAIEKLTVLGTGVQLIQTRGRYLIQSVSKELSMDHTAVLGEAEKTQQGFVSVSSLTSSLNWPRERAHKALDDLVMEGYGWIDEQNGKERTVWFPALFPQSI